MQTSDFDYELPPELIAQQPAERRDGSRLMVVDRAQGTFTHRQFTDFPEQLRAGDLLVLNNSKVIPASLTALKEETGARIGLLLIEEVGTNQWWALAKPAKRFKSGTEVRLLLPDGSPTEITARPLERNDEGHVLLEFAGTTDISLDLERIGAPPLPPYIDRKSQGTSPADRQRYQTVFAQTPGSVAAPTAGLHFTDAILETIRAKGIRTAEVTLHVGLGTFLPVKVDKLEEHRMHEERYILPQATADAIAETRSNGGRVVAVGTTSIRVLESIAAECDGQIEARAGRTQIFIYPPYQFRVVDALLTNFHLPQSTLLMLISALMAPGETGGRELALAAYREAVKERYRFFSYGDAMFIA